MEPPPRTSMDPSQVRFALTGQDLDAFYRDAFEHSPPFAISRISIAQAMRSILLLAAILAAMQGYVSWVLLWQRAAFSVAGSAVGVLLVIVILAATFWNQMGRNRGERAAVMSKRMIDLYKKGLAPGWDSPQTVAVLEDGLKIEEAIGTRVLAWGKGVLRMVEAPRHLLIYTPSGAGYIVPHSAFGSDAERERFLGEAKRLFGASTGNELSQVHAMLMEKDTPCPLCRYNLRGSPGDYCPECGLRLAPALLGGGRA